MPWPEPKSNAVFDCAGLRKALGLTQPNMAILVGTTERSYRRWEREGVVPRGESLSILRGMRAELQAAHVPPVAALPIGIVPSSL